MKVAVVGAGGPAGLAALKTLQDRNNSNVFTDIVGFEKNASVGGTWIYEPLDKPLDVRQHDEADIKTAMYAGLHTNLPHDLMQYPDFPFHPNTPLFPTHQQVLEYLQDYTSHYHLDHSIRFQHKVENVEWIQEQGMWKVQVLDIIHESTLTDYFHAVVVANGHFNCPNIPLIPGFTEFKGEIIHSKSYRTPDYFTNKTVIVVGSGSSGLDISREIKAVAKKVYLSVKNMTQETSIEMIQPLKRLFGKSVETSDDRVLSNVDVVLFATGYKYAFPFLRTLDQLSPSQQLISDGQSVSNLYRGIFYIPNPTLTFIGLHVKLDPFPLFHLQAELVSHVYAGLCLPECTPQAMRLFEQSQAEKLSLQCPTNSNIERQKFILGCDGKEWQYEYWDSLSSLFGGPLVDPARPERRKVVIESRKKILGY